MKCKRKIRTTKQLSVWLQSHKSSIISHYLLYRTQKKNQSKENEHVSLLSLGNLHLNCLGHFTINLLYFFFESFLLASSIMHSFFCFALKNCIQHRDFQTIRRSNNRNVDNTLDFFDQILFCNEIRINLLPILINFCYSISLLTAIFFSFDSPIEVVMSTRQCIEMKSINYVVVSFPSLDYPVSLTNCMWNTWIECWLIIVFFFFVV